MYPLTRPGTVALAVTVTHAICVCPGVMPGTVPPDPAAVVDQRHRPVDEVFPEFRVSPLKAAQAAWRTSAAAITTASGITIEGDDFAGALRGYVHARLVPVVPTSKNMSPLIEVSGN